MIIEKRGDLVDYWRTGKRIGITTNGFVKLNGEAVMGRGIALTMRNECSGLAGSIGNGIRSFGNVPVYFPEYNVFTFPVKHHWQQPADPDLIVKSAYLVVAMAKARGWAYIDINRPGCGNGRLNWSDVKPLIQPAFNDLIVNVWDFA